MLRENILFLINGVHHPPHQGENPVFRYKGIAKNYPVYHTQLQTYVNVYVCTYMPAQHFYKSLNIQLSLFNN